MNPWESEHEKEWTPTAQVLHVLQEHLDHASDTTGAQLKLLCGADLLESFAVPNLWPDKDVCMFVQVFVCVHVAFIFVARRRCRYICESV